MHATVVENVLGYSLQTELALPLKLHVLSSATEEPKWEGYPPDFPVVSIELGKCPLIRKMSTDPSEVGPNRF